jgi:hypothetical protein
MPLGNMSAKLTFGTFCLILGLFLAVVMLIERNTPGLEKRTGFWGLVGVALTVVGLSLLFVGV